MLRRRVWIAAAALVAVGLFAAAAHAATGRIAFGSYRGGTSGIWAVNADGNGLTRLTATAGAAFEGQPAYSPDGSRIAYVCGNFEICVMNADGSGQMRLTTTGWPARFEYDFDPTWSPDGTKLAFGSTRGGRGAIWTVRSDGTALTRVTNGPDGEPAWSPDGRTIVFVRSGAHEHLYSIDAAGGAPRRLTDTAADDSNPAWSPDGHTIAFTRTRGLVSHLYAIDPRGGARRRLTRGLVDEDGAAWSPDGTTIAFSRGRTGPHGGVGIDLMNADGSGVRVLTGGAGIDGYPTWQPRPAAPGGATATVPPSTATPDAQVVGALVQWSAAFGSAFEGMWEVTFLPSPRVDAIAAATTRTRATLAGLRPASRRGHSVKRKLLDALTSGDDFVRASRRALRDLARGHLVNAQLDELDADLDALALLLGVADAAHTARVGG
jgi:Tol biopolymer transport system component